MTGQYDSAWIVLSPPFSEDGDAIRFFRDYAGLLAEKQADDHERSNFDTALAAALGDLPAVAQTVALQAQLLVLTDLANQKWDIRLTGAGEVEVRRPTELSCDPKQEKERIRAQELVKRDEQLRTPATRAFIHRMESQTLHKGRFVSIYSLMRDGRELAEGLRAASLLSAGDRLLALRKVIQPYLEFVDHAEYCDHTGLRLQDIWRYFRHTWTNQYTSTPGRSMAFLVRDRAHPFHPIVGIGAIGSPIVQIRERDAWIGWHTATFMDHVREAPSADLGVWLRKTVGIAVNELYVDDFIEEGLLSPSDILSPSPKIVDRLAQHGRVQRELHHRLARARDLKGTPTESSSGGRRGHWERRARSHLYRSKRALSLADMLRSRAVLNEHLPATITSENVAKLLASPAGRRVVARVLRKAKADHVGVAMADITVCGAVAPYNPILGGKLVSMLAVGPEVVAAYRQKYLNQQSEIASSMAGRPIVRTSDLVFLGTTSLYGVGSSQYNRLRMPGERIGARPGEYLAYQELGKSDAYGTSQFSSDTVAALVSLIQQSGNGRRVNSIFGEGVSPKLRKIREGLGALNLPADTLLQHGRQRIVYGISLVRNLREYLLGMDDDPDYFFEMGQPRQATEEISDWWIQRWLSKRIKSDHVLSRVESHTLVRPVRHGARVLLPRVDDDQLPLFEDFVP